MTDSRRMARRLTLEWLEERTVLSVTTARIELPAVNVHTDMTAKSHILVEFKPGQRPVALPGTRLGESYNFFKQLYRVELVSVTAQQAVTSYRADPRVKTADFDYVITAAWTPNDPRFRDQYHLNNTGQNNGTIGADIQAVRGWSGIINTNRLPIAVMDSGIDYTHPDLYLNIWINQAEIPASRRVNLVDVDRDGLITFRDLNNPINIGPGKITDLNKNGYIDAGDILMPMVFDAQGRDIGGGWVDGIDQDGNKYADDLIGWNPTKNNNNPLDDFGHGTHVAGIIGAVGNNGVGVTGVSWMAQLVPVKFLNQYGAGSIGWFIEGLDWALSKGIKISNNSWNDSGYTPILFEAVARAAEKGHLFVAAAGNQARNTDNAPVYPANFNLPNVVSVGATDRNDRMTSFSNFGTKSVHIVAPGDSILSTNRNNSYGLRTGTSMSTPQVTAVMAMVWILRPEWNYQQVINWVMATATRLPSLNGKVMSGRLNFHAAIQVPARNAAQPPRERLTNFNGVSGSSSGWVAPSSYLQEFVAQGNAASVVSILEALHKRSERVTFAQG